MKHLFVPYELALLAKEKGFNEPCLAYYSEDHIYLTDEIEGFTNKSLDRSNKIRQENLIAAPLYQQLVDWFRIEHAIDVCFCTPLMFEVFIGGISHSKHYIKEGTYTEETSNFYYEAFNKALAEAFKLI